MHNWHEIVTSNGKTKVVKNEKKESHRVHILVFRCLPSLNTSIETGQFAMRLASTGPLSINSQYKKYSKKNLLQPKKFLKIKRSHFFPSHFRW